MIKQPKFEAPDRRAPPDRVGTVAMNDEADVTCRIEPFKFKPRLLSPIYEGQTASSPALDRTQARGSHYQELTLSPLTADLVRHHQRSKRATIAEHRDCKALAHDNNSAIRVSDDT